MAKAEMNFDGLREDKGVHTGGILISTLRMLRVLQTTPARRKGLARKLFYPGALGLSHRNGGDMTLRLHRSHLIILSVISFLLAFAAVSRAELATYMYDELNRLIRVQYDDGAVVQYTYDGAGNRLQIQQPDLIPPATTASPLGGFYNVNKSVALICDDGSGGSGCDKIYFTTNGITPTASSTVYSSPINITTTTTLKFFANDRNGNSETVKSQTYTIDKTAPTGSILINSNASWTTSTSVTLTLTCNDTNGCSQMQFSTDPYGTYTTPEAYTSTRAWTLPSGDSTKTVCAKLKDPAGNWGGYLCDYIVLDTVPPTGTIRINSGAGATNCTTVTLNLTCSDATSGCGYMKFSNDGVTYSGIQTIASSTPWTLTTGDGNKTVYIIFRDAAGNWSNAYSSAILLDTVKPTTTASPAGGTYGTAQTVTLTCSDASGSGCGNIYYTTNGSTPTTSSSVYSSPLAITTTTTLKYFAKDVAGNSETMRTQVYTIGGP